MTKLSMLACVKSAFWVTDAEELFRSVKQLSSQAAVVCRAFQVQGDLGTHRAPLSQGSLCVPERSVQQTEHTARVFFWLVLQKQVDVFRFCLK